LSGIEEQLRRDLLEWIAEDCRTRDRLAETGELWSGYHPEMEAVHRRNAERLEGVVAAHGWPGRTLVGDDGADAAFRIAQHAIGEPERMRSWLVLVHEAAGHGDADPANAAMMEDRIRVYEGRLQLYGTQLDWNESGDAMVPMGGVDSPDTIDERRRAVGLGPMEWSRAAPDGELGPVDVAKRRRELDAWAEKVGWRSTGRRP
jgi:hypothetical protein